MRPFLYRSENVYVIYTQKSCGFCVMAKELLEAHSQEYTEIAIDKDNEAKTYIKSFAKTVPQIFYKEQLIGGYEELFEYLHYLDKD